MLRGDSVYDDTGCQAVFAEELSFVSHKSSRHNNPSTWNVWEASAAASGYTQVKMKYAPRLLRHPGTELSTIWIRPPRIRRPVNWDKIDEPVFPWQGNVYGHPLVGFLWECKLEERLLQEDWRQVKSWEGFVLRSKNQIVLVSSRR